MKPAKLPLNYLHVHSAELSPFRNKNSEWVRVRACACCCESVGCVCFSILLSVCVCVCFECVRVLCVFLSVYWCVSMCLLVCFLMLLYFAENWQASPPVADWQNRL